MTENRIQNTIPPPPYPLPQGEVGDSNIPSPSRGEGEGAGESLCSDIAHGGNIYRLAEELKMPEGKIIDFSASINPLGVPGSVISEIRNNAKNLFNYPDPDATELRQSLSEYHRISPESIICGNGSTELIYLIARTLRPKKVLIPAPTFSEYGRAITLLQKTEDRRQKTAPPTHPSPPMGKGKGGGEDPGSVPCALDSNYIKYLMLDKEKGFEIDPDAFIYAMRSCEAAFLCNPNNPTGRLLRREDVKKIAEAAKKIKCYLLLDEAFIDFCPEDSIIKEVENNPYLIVLRSMTKFYALSGLRLGYGVFPSHLIGRLKEYKEPWTVNNLAQRAGVAALKDKVYRNETFRIIRHEKQFMENGFKKLGIDYIPSSVNYYLIRLDNTEEVITSLRSNGILVRECSNFTGLDESYIRVAVKSRRDNARLLKELSLWLKA